MAQSTDRKKDSALLAKRAAEVQRGGARAAVLGINDGLVSVLCIVLGVAAAHSSHKAVLLAGFAGLVAGAMSMAAGEWISVQSQVELFHGVLNDLQSLVKTDRELLTQQLEKKFIGRGMQTGTATQAVSEFASSDEQLYNEYALNVVEINKNELGSPWTAAISSLLLFTAGSMVALAPWFFISGQTAIILSIIFTAAGGLGVGAYVARSSGNNIIKGAVRQLLIIVGAALITYFIGHLFGVAVS